MKNLLIAIALIIVAVLLYSSIRGTDDDGLTSAMPAPGFLDTPEMIVGSDETMEEDTSETVVTYVDGGFRPKTIEINQGETVTFVNESTNRMWVASANHPTHKTYPEKTDDDCLGSSFDTCAPMVNGGSWSFTFNEVGEWGYHNHIRSSDWGMVTVK